LEGLDHTYTCVASRQALHPSLCPTEIEAMQQILEGHATKNVPSMVAGVRHTPDAEQPLALNHAKPFPCGVTSGVADAAILTGGDNCVSHSFERAVRENMIEVELEEGCASTKELYVEGRTTCRHPTLEPQLPCS